MRKAILAFIFILVSFLSIGSFCYAGGTYNYFVNLASQVIGILPVANGGTGGNGVQQPINMKAVGACGITDATSIWNTQTAIAASTGQGIYIPGGCTIKHSGTLTLDGSSSCISLLGDGPASILDATDTASTNPQQSLFIKGCVNISGINFSSENTTAARVSNRNASAITVNTGDSLTNYKIHDNYFSGYFAGVFLGLNNTTHGEVYNNWFTGTSMSNPTWISAPNQDLEIHDNHYYTSGSFGDTCIETVDYNALQTSTNTSIQIHDNDIKNCVAHGISVVGGKDIIIRHNHIDTIGIRGIYVTSESAFTTSAVDNVKIIENNVSNYTGDYGIFVSGRSGFKTTNILVNGNYVYDNNASSTGGITIGSCDTCSSASIVLDKVTVTNNFVYGDGTHGLTGLQIRGVNDATFIGNTVGTFQNNGIASVIGNSGTLKIIGSKISNVGLAAASTYSAINMGTSSGFAHYDIENNSYTSGSSALAHFMTCGSALSDLLYSSTQGDTIDVYGCDAKVGLFLTKPVAQTTNYTFVLGDDTTTQYMNCGSACNLTVPPDSSVYFNNGTVLCAFSIGSVNALFAQGSGVTIDKPNTLTFDGQNSFACVVKKAANYWNAIGKLQ